MASPPSRQPSGEDSDPGHERATVLPFVTPILDRISDAIAVFDREGRLTYANTAAGQLLGGVTDMRLGRTLDEVLSNVAPAVEAARRSATETGEPTTFDLHVPSSGASLQGTLCASPDGVILHVSRGASPASPLTAARDDRLLQSKEAADRLRYYAEILDHVDDSIVATDERLVVTAWNRAAERTYGWAERDAIGCALQQVVRPERDPQQFRDLLRAVDRDGYGTGETVHHRKDGTPIRIEERLMPLRDAAGRTTGYVSVNRDVTAARAAEAELKTRELLLREAQSLARVGSWAWDVERNQVSWSDELFRIWGVPPEAFAGDYEFVRNLIHQDDREKFDELIARTARDHQPYIFEHRIVRPDGTVRVLQSRGAVVLDDAGRVRRMVGTGQDITERKHAEDELRRSRDQLRALAARLQTVREEERTRVAREIHDVMGQALTALKLDLTSLLHHTTFAEQADADLRDSTIRLLDEAIAAVRRISTELRPGILDDLGLVAAVEWAAEEFQTRTGTAVRLEMSEEDIAMDPDRATALFRIAQETLTNVARHARATEVRIRLWRENASIVLEIHDNGRGVTEEDLSAVRSLGIIGMRERALLVGGELSIRGTPGRGTTVIVRLPDPSLARSR